MPTPGLSIACTPTCSCRSMLTISSLGSVCRRTRRVPRCQGCGTRRPAAAATTPLAASDRFVANPQRCNAPPVDFSAAWMLSQSPARNPACLNSAARLHPCTAVAIHVPFLWMLMYIFLRPQVSISVQELADDAEGVSDVSSALQQHFGNLLDAESDPGWGLSNLGLPESLQVEQID